MCDVQGRYKIGNDTETDDLVWNEETIGSVELSYYPDGRPSMPEEIEIEGYTYIREDMI